VSATNGQTGEDIWVADLLFEGSGEINRITTFDEMLGCNLFDFAAGKRFNRFPDQQVHWPGGVPDLEDFMYTEYEPFDPARPTCLTRSNCAKDGTKIVHYCKNKNCSTTYAVKESCQGTTHEEFHMPDYCSRAITSELSTVYNGVDRTTSLRAGAKVLFASADKKCFWHRHVRGKRSVIASVLGKGHTEKACWNQANDYRRLYCVKYHQCKCPTGLTPEQCSLHVDSVNCCKHQYQEFLDSEYNVYKGYPLKKACIGEEGNSSCYYNAMSEPQRDFDTGEAKDFATVY